MPNLISIKLLFQFIEITLQDEFFLVNLLHVFRTHFPKNTSGELLLPYGSAPFNVLGRIAQYSIRQ